MIFIALDCNDREQWHAYIAHFSEQAMQRGLIDHRAGQQRLAVVCKPDGQAAKPVCPLAAQMALDPDLIDHFSSPVAPDASRDDGLVNLVHVYTRYGEES